MTDDRIPLRFVSANQAGANQAGANQAGANQAGANQAGANQAGPEEALLIEDGAADLVHLPLPALARPIMRFGAVAGTARPGTGHMPGCACCTGRGAAATALGDLFRARALGRVAWFTGVVAVVFDPRTIAAEVQADRLAAARFRVLP